jgi:hypothetical protein
MKDRETVTTNGRAVFYAAVWNDLRQAAMNKGWALALHGSLASDMDIMAMPWTENACSADGMIEALKTCFTDSPQIRVTNTPMPNQRLVYTLSIWADFYLDINIINASQETSLLREENENLHKDLLQETSKCMRYQEALQKIYGDNLCLSTCQELANKALNPKQ